MRVRRHTLVEAAEWHERLYSGGATIEDVESWRAWLSSNTAHRRAFEEMEDLCRTVERLIDANAEGIV